MNLNKVKITVLADNSVKDRKFKSEHGIAYWIETGDASVLFDTGQGTAFPVNAKLLKIPLKQCHAIAISHGHYDHTGGLAFALKTCPNALIYLHSDAMKRRYGFKWGHPVKSIGMPPLVRYALREKAKRIRWVRKPVEIANGIWATGPIPRMSGFEDTGGNFFIDRACQEKDLITDDQAIWIPTNLGLIVLLGCGHSGVINTLDYISKLTHREPVYAVLGGMHLLNASSDRLKRTVNALKHYDVRWIIPGHCTGDVAMEYLKRNFKKQFRKMYAGMRFPRGTKK